MDKNQYIEKCMDLLNDNKNLQTLQGHHQETTQRHSGISQKTQQRTWIFQDYMIGASYTTTACSLQENSSPAPRFYGLPKIHKTNCPMRPIVSACGTATYQLAKFLTKILQRYTGITPLFVKDSKSFSDHLRMVEISGEEELVSFDSLSLIYQHTCSNSPGRHQQTIH